ncbi:MAG TPA: M48 family metalloprotease [Alphaproteobacteria bacterium]|nr:M48 family metalloprotease [Alphaproteobacteria bacterium]
MNLIFLSTLPCYSAPDIPQGSIIQDDEIDRILNKWITVLAASANLTSVKPKVYVMASKELNAFATTGGVIVVTSGLVEACTRSEQLLGVLAHELAHVAGGHVLKMDDAIERSNMMALGGTILAGALALLTGKIEPLVAGAVGSAQIGERAFLKHSRDHETIADNNGYAYLEKAGIDPSGIAEFLTILDQKYTYRGSPYVITHPLTPERISAMKSKGGKCSHSSSHKAGPAHPAQVPSPVVAVPAKTSEPAVIPSKDCPKTPESYHTEFKRLKTKVMGFVSDLTVLYPLMAKSDGSVESLYLKAIVYYRTRKIDESIKIFDQLIKQEPNNFDLKELRGQILFENNRFLQAKEDLKEVVTHNPKATFSKILYAHLLIEEAFRSPASAKNSAKEAVSLLKSIADHLKDEPFYWRLRARALGLAGFNAEADLALAEEALLQGDIKQAANKTKKALKSSPQIKEKAKDKAKDIEASRSTTGS